MTLLLLETVVHKESVSFTSGSFTSLCRETERVVASYLFYLFIVKMSIYSITCARKYIQTEI